jgi:hypothetical protein
MSHEHNGIPCAENHQSHHEYHQHHMTHSIGQMCCQNGACEFHAVDQSAVTQYEQQRRATETAQEEADDDDTPTGKLRKYLKAARRARKVAAA